MSELRKQVTIPAEFRGEGLSGHGKVENVSTGGLFVRAEAIPDEGEMIRLRMSPAGGVRMDVTGLVWWTTKDSPSWMQDRGFGLRILDEDVVYREFVEQLG